ncbi:MAG: C25 family cysteine peptidase [Mariniblastus sp.]|nr:C25 family cysteine peptidase [Mariniblastus sp.]
MSSLVSVVCAFLAGLVSPLDPPCDTLVICPPDFQPALKAWVAYREGQGHRIRVEAPAKNSYGIRMQVRKVAASGSLKNLMIVGDCADRRAVAGRLVPTDYVQAKVNVKFGSEPEISSDNTYADVNSDGIPDLTLGRMPVDSPAELEQFIQRIKEYESPSSSGEWMRRMNFVAGMGGFGQLVDKMIEQSTKQIITDLIPPAYETSMTYGSWSSPYCPNPRRFSETTIERFNQGCMFWCYIGHGSQRRLDRVMLPDGRCEILDCESAKFLDAQQGSPIAIFLACYTGAADGPDDCLSEEMLRRPGGPIAIISSSRVAMPYAMAVLSLEMLDGYFEREVSTLGELILQAKQKLVTPQADPNQYRVLVESMGKAFSPEPGLLDEERKEHVHLMHLFGDPLLRLKKPTQVDLKVPETSQADQPISIRGVAPFNGNMTVEISYKRDRFRNRPPRRREYDSSEDAFHQYDVVYRETHELTCWQTKVQVEQGGFKIQGLVPKDASGECFVRVMIKSPDAFAMGSQPVYIDAVQD